jgi:hypothetical protein
MARKHIPLTIHKPGLAGLHKVNFVANADGQDNIIPFRYAFDDIENYTDLKSAGFFRHATKTVSSDLGGSSSEDTKTNLGFQLPPVEKLVLLCKVDTALTTDKTITITIFGSDQYGIPDKEVKISEDSDTADFEVLAGDLFEIDLYDFGLLLNDGEIKITAVSDSTDEDHISFALVARMG